MTIGLFCQARKSFSGAEGQKVPFRTYEEGAPSFKGGNFYRYNQLIFNNKSALARRMHCLLSG
jgi:hypothetical protein